MIGLWSFLKSLSPSGREERRRKKRRKDVRAMREAMAKRNRRLMPVGLRDLNVNNNPWNRKQGKRGEKKCLRK